MPRFFIAILVCLLPLKTFGEEQSLRWEVRQLAIDGNEGIDVADFNNDGRLDIIAGRSWYAAPEFVAKPVRTIEDWNDYVESNGDFAWDVDGDGWTDVIAGSFLPTEVHWYKNPGKRRLELGKMWEKHLLIDTGNSTNECQMFHDLDGDGTPEWLVNSWKKPVPMCVWRLDRETREVEVTQGKKKKTITAEMPSLKKFVINSTGNGHGMGVGDISGDGKADLLCGLGWYEQPADGPWSGEWKFHDDWQLHASVPMLVVDLDGDGRNDIIHGAAHDFGLQWWQHQGSDADGKITWKNHLIDDSFSQPHAMIMADLDGDGDDELVTGKRYYAHNARDPGGEMPPELLYYTWDKQTLKFTRHVIDRGRVGTGLQIRIADIDDDGRVDIAVAGKSGTHVVFNRGFGKNGGQ